MINVRIIKNWNYPDLMRQTPLKRGVWGDIQFTTSDDEICDFLIVLNQVPKQTIVQVPPTNIWHLTQEPPVEGTEFSRQDSPYFYLKFTPDTTQLGKQYIHSHTALPWHVNRNYDELKNISSIEKDRTLSWITSNLSYLAGHRRRLNFLEKLQEEIKFDLWGRGFQPLEDKWDGLAPYRYSLAVENYSGPHYWTEKIADCFLAWTMPIYYGATNIETYFPSDSFIRIDIAQPKEAIEIIKETIQNNAYIKNRDAIAFARELVLEKYQFFPFIKEHIHNFREHTTMPCPEVIILQPTLETKKPRKASTVWRTLARTVKKTLKGFLHV